MTRPDRWLVSTRRQVPERAGVQYEEAWQSLRAAATAAGARAWRFRAAADSSHFLEFLEFKGAEDPRAGREVRQAMDRMEQIAAGEVQEWRDASQPPRQTLDEEGDR